MLTDLPTRLTRIIKQRRLRDKLEHDHSQAAALLAAKSKNLSDLEKQLKKEQVDVDRLQGLSLTGLFYTVLGSREEQEQKERQELLAAQLKYQQAQREVESLKAELARIDEQLRGLRGVDAEYTVLLEQKESFLRQSNPQIAAELLNLSEEIGQRSAEIKEIDEAIAAASGVIDSLKQVIESLQSAEGWGTWDMLGGGMLSTAIKHSRIDDARRAAEEVQNQMARFSRELADVQRSGIDVQIEIGTFNTFADYFMDGLIFDWVVQSKIQRSLDQSRLAYQKVVQAVENLGALRKAALRGIDTLHARRNILVEQG